MSYLIEWNQAIQRTRKFGLEVPVHVVNANSKYIDQNFLDSFNSLIQTELGGLSPREICLQCFNLNLRLLPVLQKKLACDVIYTLGWIDTGDKTYFHFDDSYIDETLKKGHEKKNVRMHAWLTLSSMEIIDATFPTTYGVLNEVPDFIGRTTAMRADNLINGVTYKPMLVGTEYMKQTKMIEVVYF